MALPRPADEGSPATAAAPRVTLEVIGHADIPPPPPEPPYQPWLRGAASAILLRQLPDPSLPGRRRSAPFLFHRPVRATLAQLLVISGCVLPFAVGPWPAPRLRKLPVIGRSGPMRPESEAELDRVSDPRPLTAAELAVLPRRPRTRGECATGIRPCPWVSCRHHLFLEVKESGSIRLNHPGRDVDQLEETCSLDVAERMSANRDEFAERGLIAPHLGVSHERVRQIEAEGIERIKGARVSLAELA